VIFLPKMPYIHRIYTVYIRFWPTLLIRVHSVTYHPYVLVDGRLYRAAHFVTNTLCTCVVTKCVYVTKVGQNHIQSIYGIRGRKTTKYTVMYGVYIRFWQPYRYTVTSNTPTSVQQYSSAVTHMAHTLIHTLDQPMSIRSKSCVCDCVNCVCMCAYVCVCVYVCVCARARSLVSIAEHLKP